MGIAIAGLVIAVIGFGAAAATLPRSERLAQLSVPTALGVWFVVSKV